MFTLFHDPFYYRPTYYYQPYYRRPSLFERYLDALDRRFFSILNDDAAELLALESNGSPQKEAAPVGTTTPPPAVADGTAPTAPAQPPTESAPSKPEEKSSSPAASPTPAPAPKPVVSSRQYISHTRSTFNGHDYVEEHREKVTGSDGQTRVATRRRLGDRWYENEVHIDGEGKRTERETWHNVGDEDIEKFKQEWNDKQSGKGKFDGPAVEGSASASPSAIESQPPAGESKP
jgi:hypothetical protein